MPPTRRPELDTIKRVFFFAFAAGCLTATTSTPALAAAQTHVPQVQNVAALGPSSGPGPAAAPRRQASPVSAAAANSSRPLRARLARSSAAATAMPLARTTAVGNQIRSPSARVPRSAAASTLISPTPQAAAENSNRLLAARLARSSAAATARPPALVTFLSGPTASSLAGPPATSINATAAGSKRSSPPSEEEDASSAEEIARRAAASASESSVGIDAGGESETAYDVLARDLLLRIELIEMDKGHVARELQTPLFELGKLYVQEDQCQNAIPILQRAVLLSQRLDGVMNPKQLPLYEPLLECFVARDMIIDLQRALDQTILVAESSYGRDDIRMQAPLAHAARWFEEAGLYDNARQQYLRSIRIAEKLGGKKDVRTVIPMRGMAQTYRLEAQYAESVRSGALNAAGERSLERAANIVRMNPDTDPNLRIETLMELADWYQMAGAIRDAQKIYKEVWAIASASAGDTSASNTAKTLFDEPEPILYRARIGTALRRPPPDREKLQHYWVDFEFTVTRFGEVKNVVATDSTAPKDLQISLAENLKSTHYRPRFVNGEPTETKGIRVRQGVWVGN
jgi:hypothetical protein